MDFLTIDKVDWDGKKVVVRGDLDIGLKQGEVSKRLKVLIKTIKKLESSGAEQITIMGHKGRPEGAYKEELSLQEMVSFFQDELGGEVDFVANPNEFYESEKKFRLLENLRFNPGEEQNSSEFAISLSRFGEIYVNEAFGVSHRNHASIVGIAKLITAVAGDWFGEEVENLQKVTSNPNHPVLMILSGIKKDKLNYLSVFESKTWVDRILIGGKLPTYLPEEYKTSKTFAAKLNQDKEDITIKSIEKFEQEIAEAATIVLAGVPGKYEEEGNRLGTERVFRAVSAAKAFKVVGGGDSLVAISLFDIEEQFDWVSVGGGAMLEFLAKETLPGIQALVQSA